MRAEAIGEGEYGMLLVGNVIINRVLCDSPDFKNAKTIEEVVFQTPGGFACINSDLFQAPATDYEKELAMRVISGENFGQQQEHFGFMLRQLVRLVFQSGLIS